MTFTVNVSTAGAGGSFSASTTVTTDANGYALVGTTASQLASDFTANGIGGSFTISAAAPGVSGTAVFNLTNLQDVPVLMTILPLGMYSQVTATARSPPISKCN